ncbi:NADP-dependent oxidoreductase [Leuconostoc lactis]|uniref:NADP-dependent oxidoreductase n=1 Tax=Leuconostoc lactis TaxID=1246 RepID=UPI000815121E|nr:NADP-dependent oxidoreductase [Leuconostoc lactis]ANY12396.1 oxidoreductase [Leuconostoc lactis]
MKAAQISRYSKNINFDMNNVPQPTISETDVLIKTKFAAVNPLDLMTIHGSVKFIQSYAMPLTLGNEVVGTIIAAGSKVTDFDIGDVIYARLPLTKIGAFAEYVSVDSNAISKIPKNLNPMQAAAIPLTGLTAYQALTEALQVMPNKTLFIAGGSGGFGQVAVPIAKSFGLKVIVSGNSRSKEKILRLGADQYIDFRQENYWEALHDIDYVIDTLGSKEIEREMSIMKPGGKIVSLAAGPNLQFAKSNNLSIWQQLLFKISGSKLDKAAMNHHVTYKFIFVRSDGNQLKKITTIVERENIVPGINDRVFSFEELKSALSLVDKGGANGKVVVKF